MALANNTDTMQGNTYKLCDFGSCVMGPQSCESKEDAVALSDLISKSVTCNSTPPGQPTIRNSHALQLQSLRRLYTIFCLTSCLSSN